MALCSIGNARCLQAQQLLIQETWRFGKKYYLFFPSLCQVYFLVFEGAIQDFATLVGKYKYFCFHVKCLGNSCKQLQNHCCCSIFLKIVFSFYIIVFASQQIKAVKT